MASSDEHGLTAQPGAVVAPIVLSDGVSFVAQPDQAVRLGARWVSVIDLPLTVLVGVTGVGKSTTLARLRERVAFSLLPDRRHIADDVIIGTMQALDGQTPRPITDRVTRLEYTARYRKLFGGGVAHALTRLVIDPTRLPPPLLFDGVRGRDEVVYAVDHLPHSRFIVLHAPDEVRVQRLLGRGDAFDQTSLEVSGDVRAALAALPNVEAVFTPAQLDRLAGLTGADTGDELIKQVAIVVAERRNYDPDAARRVLEQRLPSDRLLVIDTTAAGPDAVAGQISDWL